MLMCVVGLCRVGRMGLRGMIRVHFVRDEIKEMKVSRSTA